MDERADGEVNPYRILGALLVMELSSPPPRFSLRRKRLRAAMRARLAEAFLADGAECVTGKTGRRPPRWSST